MRTCAPRVLGEGAAECLYKPFSDTALLTAINSALDQAGLGLSAAVRGPIS